LISCSQSGPLGGALGNDSKPQEDPNHDENQATHYRERFYAGKHYCPSCVKKPVFTLISVNI
jgi:hypothetical protein